MSRPALQRFAACWGNGDFGRLGHGPDCSPQWVPRVVAALADMNISAIAAGGAHTAVLAGQNRCSRALCLNALHQMSLQMAGW